jgi:hypothetical protein
MVTKIKNVRFDEQVTMLYYVNAVEPAKDSHYESNFKHGCHEEIDSNNLSDDIAGSNYDDCSRWMMSKKCMNDITPILPLRRNKEPANTTASKSISIVRRPQDALLPSNVDYKTLFMGFTIKK